MLEWFTSRLNAHRKRRNVLLQLLLLGAVLSGLWLAFIIYAPQEDPCPFELAAMQPWEHSVISVPGFEGNISLWQAGTEHSDTVILVHGLGQNASTDWRKVIPVLAQRYRVIAFDLPGFGCSKSVRGTFTPESYARVIRNIVATRATGRVTLVGHSMGGAIALRYAADYPGTLAKLFLVDAAGILVRTAYVKAIADIPVDLREGREWQQRIKAFAEEFSTALIEWVNLAPDPVDMLRSIKGHGEHSGLDRSQVGIALELLDEDFSTIVPRVVDLPVHIIWGGTDRIAPLRTAKVLHHRLDGATIDIIPDAGHVPMSSHTRTFNALLLKYLDAAPSAKKTIRTPEVSQGDLHCYNEVGNRYTGRYGTITLEGCKGITLADITAKTVRLKDSSAAFENLIVENNATAMQAVHSVVLLTNTVLSGRVALDTKDSRIDMAGTTLKGESCSLQVTQQSRVIASLCEIGSGTHDKPLHGDFHITHSSCTDTGN